MLRGIAILAAAAALCYGADGNAAAGEIARRSPRVQAALAALKKTAGEIRNQAIRSATLDALQPGTCVAHRASLTDARKAEIVRELVGAGLADPADRELATRILPSLIDDGSACPKLPQPFESAPGSSFGGHHSYPGGLAIHESFNLQSCLNFADLYRRVYGPGVALNQDLLIAAPIWHDWAKAIVFQWNADGTEFEELSFGGARQELKTPAHHILGLAETMARNLPPGLILTQASAHAAPVLGNEHKVVSWIRAAAIIAQVDPEARGYLVRAGSGEWHLPGFRPEYSIHNLSDADFVVSIPAMETADAVLKKLAAEFGYAPTDQARYNTRYRNPALSQLTAERILMLHAEGGLEAVRAELKKLRAGKIL